MVLWGGTPWVSPPIAPQTPGFGWGSTSPVPRGSAGPSTSAALTQGCREQEADIPVHPL